MAIRLRYKVKVKMIIIFMKIIILSNSQNATSPKI